MSVALSKFKVIDFGNLVTSATKQLDMDAKCKCMKGKIGPVDQIHFSFDYKFFWSDESLEGSAQMTIHDFMAEYQITPKVIDKVDEAMFKEEGMLHLEVNSFNISASEFPITVNGSR